MAMTTNATLERSCGYLAALLLPGPAIFFSSHFHFLHRTPLALSFVLIGTIARVFGRGPSILAPVATAIAFNFVVAEPEYGWSWSAQALVQTAVMLAMGLLISYLFQGQQAAQRSLQLANSALQERTDALIQAQQGSNSAAWTFNAATRQTVWYEGGSELFGRSLKEITAMGSPTNLVLNEDRPKVAAAAELTARTGQPFQVEFRALWPNGEIRWLEAIGTPAAANAALWRGVTTDITNRKTAELALIRSEKLAAAVRLASSVSHEINNPLESIVNLIYLAKSEAGSAAAQAYLEDAEKEVARIAHVTNQALRFDWQPSSPAPMDLAEALRGLLQLYEPRLAAAGIQVRMEAHPAPILDCCASEMRQALGNLIQNALEAMPKGGALRLRLRSGTDWRSGAAAVRIAVANSGAGMSPQTRKRIFEPFFTTKASTNAGLGLWAAGGIVDRHGGSIQVWSNGRPDGRGTVFCVILPLSKSPKPATAASNRLDAPEWASGSSEISDSYATPQAGAQDACAIAAGEAARSIH